MTPNNKSIKVPLTSLEVAHQTFHEHTNYIDIPDINSPTSFELFCVCVDNTSESRHLNEKLCEFIIIGKVSHIQGLDKECVVLVRSNNKNQFMTKISYQELEGKGNVTKKVIGIVILRSVKYKKAS